MGGAQGTHPPYSMNRECHNIVVYDHEYIMWWLRIYNVHVLV